MQHFSMMEKRREGGSQDDGNVVVVSETCSHLFFYKLFTTSDLTYRSFNVSYQELMSLVLFLITQANQSLFPKVKAATLCNPAENWALIYYFISILYTYFSKFPLSVLCLYYSPNIVLPVGLLSCRSVILLILESYWLYLRIQTS